MTPARRARLLAQGQRDVADGIKTLAGGDHVLCAACRRPIRTLSWTVSVASPRRAKQYHYRCWRWGGVPELRTLQAARRLNRRQRRARAQGGGGIMPAPADRPDAGVGTGGVL